MWKLKRLAVILISIAVYSCQGAGGAGFAETEAIVSAMPVKKRTHSCSECSKPFSYKSDLDRHMRVHTGERPYACSRCDKAFSQKVTLTDHMRTHIGRKPYRCSECGLKFSQKGNLTTHRRKCKGIQVGNFEDPTVLDEYFKSKIIRAKDILTVGPEVLEKIWGAAAAAKASAASKNLD